MRKPAFVLCLLVGGCAMSGVDPSKAPISQNPQTSEGATPQALAANALKVDIRSFANEPVCRKEQQTGSRIAVERCYTPNAAEDEVAKYIIREEVEFMRQQQIYRDQARQARDAAIRQSALGGQR